jgi:hypothetical protein
VKGRSISLFAVAQQVSASPVIRGISMIGSFGLPVHRGEQGPNRLNQPQTVWGSL